MSELRDPVDARVTLPTRIVMLLGGLMVTMALSAVAPVLAGIEHDLAVTADDKLLVKLMVPAASAAMVLGAPTTGFLIDRIGLRSLLILHGLLFTLAGTAGFYLENLQLLLASRFFVGFAASGMATISMTLINTRLEGLPRARWMGFHIATAMLGGLVVFPAIGALGEIGWRWPFLVFFVGLLVSALAALGLSADRTRGVGRPPARLSSGANPFRWFPLWYLPLALAIGGVTYLPTVYLAFIARDIGLSSPSTLSMIMLADALIGAMMSLLFGWSQRWVSSYAAFAFSFCCTGTGMLIVSMASDVTMVVVGMLVFGCGLGWFMPNLMNSLSQRVARSQQGAAVGILKATHFLASPLAVIAVEPISRAHGSAGATAASATVALSAAVIFAFLAASRPRGKELATGGA